MKVAENVCGRLRPGIPKKLSCTQVFVARTTTLSPSAITSSIVHVCSMGPIVRKSSRTPSGPGGGSTGILCIVHVGAVISQISSILCSLTRSSHRRAIVLLSSIETIALPPLLSPKTERHASLSHLTSNHNVLPLVTHLPSPATAERAGAVRDPGPLPSGPADTLRR